MINIRAMGNLTYKERCRLFFSFNSSIYYADSVTVPHVPVSIQGVRHFPFLNFFRRWRQNSGKCEGGERGGAVAMSTDEGQTFGHSPAFETITGIRKACQR